MASKIYILINQGNKWVSSRGLSVLLVLEEDYAEYFLEMNQSWDEPILEDGHMFSAKGSLTHARKEDLLGQLRMGTQAAWKINKS